ncbi:hypothetical protein BST12_09425 [Mycobacterium angelicum]|uniref:VOC domain-containing protein n=1 Tax=Mycobacterium angelicum TaxID=470074 RepID=A0A1W9ZX63_MYCAN|nr:hypothetical protein BST12_09425 [Mycobacterium angelicum]
MTEATDTIPRPAALPYLCVGDARAAIAWYADAFGAVVVGDPIVMEDGRIGHAELELAGGVLYLADEYPELGLKAPAPQAVSVSLMLQVADTDTALQRGPRNAGSVTVPMWTVADIDVAVARVRETGGTVLQEPARQPYGVSAECADNQGARFYLGEF